MYCEFNQVHLRQCKCPPGPFAVYIREGLPCNTGEVCTYHMSYMGKEAGRSEKVHICCLESFLPQTVPQAFEYFNVCGWLPKFFSDDNTVGVYAASLSYKVH